jgi:hypothetical protein
VNALGDAHDGRRGQGVGVGKAALRPHGAGGRGVGRHGGWGSSAPGGGEVEKPEWRGREQVRWGSPSGHWSTMHWMTYCIGEK